MARARTTIDAWEIQVNYGHGDGWETECIEFSRVEMRENLKVYRENSPGAIRVKKRRLPKSDFTPEELKEITERAQRLTLEYYAARRAKRAALAAVTAV